MYFTRSFGPIAAIALSVTISGCAVPEGDVDIYDPYETQNRAVHGFNRGLDRALVRPTANAYGTVLPRPVRAGVSNFAGNLATPGSVVNDVLQANIEDAVHNTFRFLINTTIGVAGLFDPATSFGLEERESDFGETLYVWGVDEGAYLELPVIGPSTQRDAAGIVVDLFTNPLTLDLPDHERYAATATSVAAGIDSRFVLGSTIDGILYESADSYAQLRTLYLQNRRFRLSGGTSEDEVFDPYEDLDAQ